MPAALSGLFKKRLIRTDFRSSVPWVCAISPCNLAAMVLRLPGIAADDLADAAEKTMKAVKG